MNVPGRRQKREESDMAKEGNAKLQGERQQLESGEGRRRKARRQGGREVRLAG